MRATAIRNALEAGALGEVFDRREIALLEYARTLTRLPGSVTRNSIDEMRGAGLGDGEILEANQVVSYFAYVNRTVLGLGVTTRGDTLGLSPGDTDDAGDWRHT